MSERNSSPLATSMISNKVASAKLSREKKCVILVEGSTDRKFYELFKKNDAIEIQEIGCFSTKEKKYPLGDRKLTGKEAIIHQVEKNDTDKYFFGIVDKDYDNCQIEDKTKLFVTDANSLETMIVKYVGIDDFNKLVIEAISSTNNRLFYTIKENLKNIENNLTEDSLKWAFYIGCFRMLNEELHLNLNFKEIKLNNDYLKNFLIDTKDNCKRFDFNKEEFQKQLLSRKKINTDKIDTYMKKYTEAEAWRICQGHDIFDFIDAISRNFTKSIRNEESVVPFWESNKLLKNTRITKQLISKFANSELQIWFDYINKQKVTLSNLS